MPTFEKCANDVSEMAAGILKEFETHKPLLLHKVRVDFVYAFADLDDDGEPTNNALTHHGVQALGICRKLPLKDRVMGRGDAEISLDGDWWLKVASEEQKRALLDHELHHIAINVKTPMDAIGPPNLKMRKHDVDIGWFSIIAERHGKNSIEQRQAKSIMDMHGQMLWPDLFKCLPEPKKK